MIKALIVDDEPIARQILREELGTYAGISIVGEADNGVVTVDLLQRLTPDLVFLDLCMPKSSGFDVIRFRTATPLSIIIVVSACQHCAREALLAGADGCLLKPVDPVRLQIALEQISQRFF